MIFISVKLDPEANALLQALATQERRSKREQLAVSAVAHARQQLPDFVYQPVKTKRTK